MSIGSSKFIFAPLAVVGGLLLGPTVAPVLSLASVPREKDTSSGKTSAAPVLDAEAIGISGGNEPARSVKPEHDEVELQVPFKASGTHTCFKSGTSFRHTCEVSGEGYADCSKARAALESDDCCSRTEAGGRSFSFSMNTCGPE